MNNPVFLLPRDLLNIVLVYVYECTQSELVQDLNFYIEWQNTVPAMFLSASLIDTRYYYGVANPMLPYHPFTPRKYLRMRPCDIWAATLPAFVNMICGERIREIGTYKGCIQRWTSDCISNREIQYYIILASKGFRKITSDHFRLSHPSFFVKEALRQIRSSSVF